VKVVNYDISDLRGDAFIIQAARILRDVQLILNSGILLNDNISGKVVSVNFTVANSDVRIDHGLDRIPIGYVQIGQSVATTVYDGTTSTTKNNIFLRSSAIGTVKLLIT